MKVYDIFLKMIIWQKKQNISDPVLSMYEAEKKMYDKT